MRRNGDKEGELCGAFVGCALRQVLQYSTVRVSASYREEFCLLKREYRQFWVGVKSSKSTVDLNRRKKHLFLKLETHMQLGMPLIKFIDFRSLFSTRSFILAILIQYSHVI